MRFLSKHISHPAALLAILVSLVIIGHWIIVPQTSEIYDGSGIVKFNTALCMGLSGVALIFANRESLSGKAKIISNICIILVLALSVVTLAQFVFGFNTGIDQLFWKEIDPQPGTAPGRMSYTACLLYIMVCTSMLMLRRKKLHIVAQVLLMIAFIFLSILLILYAAQPTPVKLLKKPTPVYTILGILFLLIGVFFSKPMQYLKFSLQKRVAAFMLFALLFIIIVFYSFVESSKRARQTAAAVESTHNVLAKCQSIMKDALNIETGSRGYIISRNESFLEPYHDGIRDIYSTYNELKGLEGVNKITEGRMDSLKHLIDANIELRQKQVLYVKADNHEAINLIFSDGTNKLLMDSLRTIVGRIENDENKLLAHYKEVNESTLSGTFRVIIFFKSITALLLVFAFVSIYKNVKQRNKAEQHIRELNTNLAKKVEQKSRELVDSELHFRNILDNLLEGVQIVGFDWRYRYVNEAFLKHAKYKREELEGFTVQEKYPGIENTPVYKAYERCFKERIPIHMENEFTFPDGSQGWFELSFQPVPEGIFILSVDISERKRSELELVDANKMLDRRAAELQASNTELERFAYVASHDLQEPLRMVSSFLHLLERKLGPSLEPAHKEYIDFAVDGAERMKTLIQDLLQYSRIGTSKQDFTPVNCNEVLENVKSALSISIHETGARIIAQNLPVVKAAEAQMLQLFQNLIGNAIKYKSETAPVIEVGCKDKGDKWEFFVKDNGIGIDPKFFDKIFIIFQRLHNKTEYSGTGIGLAICKKIVERHGGNLWLESTLGQGSTFYFTLPKVH